MMRVVLPAIVGIALLLGWQAACTSFHVPPYILPSPAAIGASLWLNRDTLVMALESTLTVTLVALGFATVVGTLIAFLFVQSRALEISLFPYVVMLQVTPIVAIAPLIIILVHDTFWSLVICAAVIALFPVISNTGTGLRSVDPGLLAFFRMNKASRLQTLWRLRIPSALPFFLAGMRISSGLSLVGAVVAEFVAGTGGHSAGLAYEILQSSFQLDIPKMFAGLVLITLAGIALTAAMAGISRLLLRWQETG